MTEENQALQRHLQRKYEKELEKVKVSVHFMLKSHITQLLMLRNLRYLHVFFEKAV